jgi:M6 family metalloprotease-like protein
MCISAASQSFTLTIAKWPCCDVDTLAAVKRSLLGTGLLVASVFCVAGCGSDNDDQIESSRENSVPVATVPVATVPVATVPVTTVPVATVPVATVPVATVPVAVPVATVPVTTVPVTTVPVTTTTLLDQFSPASDCYLSSSSDADMTGWEPALSLSHQRPGHRLSSTGAINVVVLFAEFKDVRATASTQSIFSIISPGAENFLDDQSNKRLKLSFAPHHKWLRLKDNASKYGDAIKTYEGHHDFMQEAIELADFEVSFVGADAVLVVATPNAKEIGYGPTWMGLPSFPLIADGQNMTNGITSGADLTYWGDLWYPHEFGHSLGLPDLYGASIPGRNGFTRPYSLMDLISSTAPGYMGYSRWILRWLDDTQVSCVRTDTTVRLTPLATPGGSKLAIVPLSSSSALVVEVRRAIGYDSRLKSDGAVVYLVETNNGFGGSYGDGPMEVLNGGDPLEQGDSVSHERVSFEVLVSGQSGDSIRITFGN